LNRKGIFFAMRKNPNLDINNIPVKQRPGEKSIDALLDTALALSLEDDFPNHLLVEELAWLKNTMNIDLDEANRIVYEVLQEGLESFRNELETKPDVPVFYKISEIRVANFKTAEESINKAVKIANKHSCLGLLTNAFEEYCWKEARNNEPLQRALRVSGVENLLRKLGVIRPEHRERESKYSVGSEDSGSNSEW